VCDLASSLEITVSGILPLSFKKGGKPKPWNIGENLKALKK
jgi:hypothetical protein